MNCSQKENGFYSAEEMEAACEEPGGEGRITVLVHQEAVAGNCPMNWQCRHQFVQYSRRGSLKLTEAYSGFFVILKLLYSSYFSFRKVFLFYILAEYLIFDPYMREMHYLVREMADTAIGVQYRKVAVGEVIHGVGKVCL